MEVLEESNKDILSLTQFPRADLDLSLSLSFTSTSSFTTSSNSTSSTFTTPRSSVSLSLPSFSSHSSTLAPHPHSSHSAHWQSLASSPFPLQLQHLSLIRPLGAGHLSKVFLCRLKQSPPAPSSALFALKVIDLNTLPSETSHSHVLAEARALASLDHPFLPTLYARIEASHYSCFLIDYCPGGDLHSLLRRRPQSRLPLAAARFYSAEILLALEYLHSLGFVYRDLKPENVLLQSDGHVMLSDFDLSFIAPVSPKVHRRRLNKQMKNQHKNANLESEELEFVAEPDTAFSKDCVGTHEYLSPEMVTGAGHGNAVDWWAFGVFLYELLYGRTPFKGATKEATLKNILNKELRFPSLQGSTLEDDEEMAKARDLITRLLEREPRKRLGASRGAAEIKRHPFFKGVQWALIRCVTPPVVPTVPELAEKGGDGSSTVKAVRFKWGSWNNMTSGGKKGKGKGKGLTAKNNIRKNRGFFGKIGLDKMGSFSFCGLIRFKSSNGKNKDKK